MDIWGLELMRYKLLFFIVLLMFVVLTGILLYKSSGLLSNIEDQLVNYLEDNYQIVIEVGETSFWPINQMILKNAKISSTKSKFSISVPELSIYYDFFAFLSTARNPGNAIDFISFNKPVIKIIGTEKKTDSDKSSDLDEATIRDSIFEVLNGLYATAPFQIKVDDGDLIYTNSNNNIQLKRLNLLFKVISEDESRLQLDTAAYTDKLIRDKYGINLLSFENLKLVMSLSGDSWQGNLETDYIEIPKLSEHIEKNEDTIVNYSDVKGLIKSKIFFSGEGLTLAEYNGVFSVKNGQGEFNIQNSPGEIPVNPIYSLKDQKLSFRDFNGQIQYDSSNDMIFAEEIEFELNQNLFRLNGRLEVLPNDQLDVFAHLRTNQLDLTKFDFLPENLDIEGLMVMDYTVEGLLSNLNMNLDLSLLDGEVNNLKIENMVSSLRYYQGNTYLDQLNFVLNETNQFTMNGVLKNDKEYSFDLEGRDLDIGLLNQFDYFSESFGDKYSDIRGLVNLTANVTGKNLKMENLNAAGQIEIVEPAIYLSNIDKEETGIEGELTNVKEEGKFIKKEVKLSRISSEFYLSEEKLFLHQGMVTSDLGELAISGEIGFNDQDVNLKIDSDYLNIGELLAYFGNEKLNRVAINDITGELSLDGNIQGKMNSPLFTAKIFSNEGSLNGYRYNDFTANLNYYNRELAINNLNLNYQQAVIRGQALLDLRSDQPTLNGDLTTDGSSYELISAVLKQENITEKSLPFYGNVDLMLSFEGSFANPTIALQARSTDTNIMFNNNQISIDLLELDMDGGTEGFYIDELSLTKGEASIKADGIVSQKLLDLRYQVDNLSFQYILEEINNTQVDGLMELTGSISGTLESPLVNGEIIVNNMEYNQNSIGSLNGDLLYFGEQLKLDGLSWKNEQGEYIIDGEIDNILLQPNLNLALSTEKGYLQDFAFFNEEIEGYALYNYNFRGEALVKGPINDIYTGLDFKMINSDNPSDTIQIVGGIGQQIDLSIQGNGVTIDKFLSNYTDTSIVGEVEFNGEISGKFDTFELLLDTKMSNVVLGEVFVKDIQGKIEIKEGNIVTFDQEILFSSNSSSNIRGSLPFKEGLDGLNLSLNLKRFPLQLLSVYSKLWTDISGIISGNIELSGGLNNPTLAGELNINNTGFDLGLADKFSNITGDAILNGQQIMLKSISGRHGEGDFLITGLLKPFDENENIDLVLQGKDLPFDYGSFKGQFDPDLTITGSFKEPFIKAELLTHNLDVRMPFEWPGSTTAGSNLKFDLTLLPGKDVYLLNKNINILVQDGSLNISNLDNQVVFSGELTSRQGVFDFYNNRFIMEEGTALFERSFDENNAYIPTVDVSAWTNIGGTKVEVMLTGKANQMVTTFNSSPPLSQDEILTLLTSRGGLGDFTAGDIGDAVQSELYRMLYSQLQLDFVQNIQDKIKNIFALDRLEVDTYNLGWNDQLSIYIGKYLNQHLYLEYTDVIVTGNDDLLSDNQGELSLQYILNDNITIESSWQGEDNYSISLETNFKF